MRRDVFAEWLARGGFSQKPRGDGSGKCSTFGRPSYTSPSLFSREEQWRDSRVGLVRLGSDGDSCNSSLRNVAPKRPPSEGRVTQGPDFFLAKSNGETREWDSCDSAQMGTRVTRPFETLLRNVHLRKAELHEALTFFSRRAMERFQSGTRATPLRWGLV